MSSLKDTLENIRQAFRGEYIARDESGVSYEDRYRRLDHAVGRKGFIQDRQNLARDMKATLRYYGQKKGRAEG